MINCHISSFGPLCSQLMLEQILRTDMPAFAETLDNIIGDADKERIEGWLRIATEVADDFEWKAVHDRISAIRGRLKKRITQRELAFELRVLREAIDDGLKWQFIYRYPDAKASVLKTWQDDWAQVLKSFPSTQNDILAAVDLWALGHSTACVFHLMRVLEHGLRALARDVGRSFDVQNWQNIIDQIESEIRTQGKALPAGVAKSERLRFLSEAAKEFAYFKDGWRNYVSHNRSTYDEFQARGALEHVKSFMKTLSTRLSDRED